MIKNKKLFVVAIILLIAFSIGFSIYMQNDIKSFKLLGIAFIVSAIVGFAFYTLLYMSLDRKANMVKIYRRVIVLAVIVFIVGLLLVFLW